MGFNTIGFNNFKAFGPTMQTFSKKPITLVYGPNSVGKSSLLHMIMYADFIDMTDNTELFSTDLFGDRLDLGGFKNTVHKHDVKKGMTFTKEVDDCSNVLKAYFDDSLKESNAELDIYLSQSHSCRQQIIIRENSYAASEEVKKSEHYNPQEIEYTYFIDNEPFIQSNIYFDNGDINYGTSTKTIMIHKHTILSILNLPPITVGDRWMEQVIEKCYDSPIFDNQNELVKWQEKIYLYDKKRELEFQNNLENIKEELEKSEEARLDEFKERLLKMLNDPLARLVLPSLSDPYQTELHFQDNLKKLMTSISKLFQNTPIHYCRCC